MCMWEMSRAPPNTRFLRPTRVHIPKRQFDRLIRFCWTRGFFCRARAAYSLYFAIGPQKSTFLLGDQGPCLILIPRAHPSPHSPNGISIGSTDFATHRELLAQQPDGALPVGARHGTALDHEALLLLEPVCLSVCLSVLLLELTDELLVHLVDRQTTLHDCVAIGRNRPLADERLVHLVDRQTTLHDMCSNRP